MSRTLAAAVMAGLALGWPALAQTPKPQIFRAGADTVPVFVTVTDKSGHLVTDLTKSDFTVTDNGKPQTITIFDNAPQPIRLIVLVDISGSMAGNLNLLRRAGAELIVHLGPDDLARVGTFGETIDIGPVFTRDERELLASLPLGIPQNAPTPLWTSIDKAMSLFGKAETREGRPVVVVMSDGKDSGPRFGQKWITQVDVIDRANAEDVMIYGVGVQSRGPLGGMAGDMRAALVQNLPDPGLAKVAEESGGGYMELRSHGDLGEAFGHVLDELHHQYLLGFSPDKRDGKEHKIEVKTTVKNAKVTARKSYRAK